MLRICVVGLGYVGLTLSTALARAGFDVYGLERDSEHAAAILAGEPPYHDRMLKSELKSSLAEGRLKVIDGADFPTGKAFDAAFSCVGTPLKKGSRTPDLSQLKSAATSIGRVLQKETVVVNRSTVPVGSTRTVFKLILEKESGLSAGDDFLLACAPERTVEGAALEELEHLPQIVGGINDESVNRTVDILNRLTRTLVRVSSLEAAEITKLFDNTYRDVNIALGNLFGLMCEDLNLDASEVISAANLNYSRNRIFSPGAGAGGACLSKDPFILLASLPEQGRYRWIQLARNINEGMPVHVADILQRELSKLGTPMQGASILVLGFAFKGHPPTESVRDSPTKILVRELGGNGAKVFGYDPVVKPGVIKVMGADPIGDLEVLRSGVDAAVAMTNSRTFSDLDLTPLRRKGKPLLVVDGWNILKGTVTSPGIVYRCLGSGRLPNDTG